MTPNVTTDQAGKIKDQGIINALKDMLEQSVDRKIISNSADTRVLTIGGKKLVISTCRTKMESENFQFSH